MKSEGRGRSAPHSRQVVFVNGIPVVVLEFKSAVKETQRSWTLEKQLTVRYHRDIPELLKYNTFVVISDGANNKYGSLFGPRLFLCMAES